MFQTTLQQFKKSEMSVVRQHEEFIWLHDRFVENEDYAGIVVSNVWDPVSQHQSFHAHIH